MNKSNYQHLTRDDLIALAESELRPQEAIFSQIGDDRYYRQTFLALLSNSGPVAELVEIKGGVVSGVINLESLGVEAPSRRPRHEEL